MPCAILPSVLLAEANTSVYETVGNCSLSFWPSFYYDKSILVMQGNIVNSFPIMETKHLKSLLKKPGQNKESSKKRVTFCSTVKFYTGGSAPITGLLGTSRKHLSEIEKVDAMVKTLNVEAEHSNLSSVNSPSLSKWFEVDDSSEAGFNLHNDEVEDFFVHKVVYDAQVLLDENENAPCGQSENEDADPGGYNCPDDADCEDFIVHQVVQNESDVLQESDADASGKDDSDGDMDVMKVKMHDGSSCTLSKKNIMHHNKLTEENIINDNLQSILKFSQNALFNEPKLSPPLQELGIDKLTSEQPNSLLLRLDISPLNSVQESDTESNSSSEDTMIMMTSEECQKNEEHIRESFLQYQRMKQNKVPSLDDSCSKTDVTDNIQSSVSDDPGIENQSEPVVETTDDVKYPETVDPIVCLSEGHFIQEDEPSDVKSEVQVFSEQAVDTSDNGNQETVAHVDLGSNGSQSCAVSKDIKSPLHSLCSFTNGSNWGSTLSSVVIPPDVREWKIAINSDNVCAGKRNTFTDSEESSLETSRSLPPMGTPNTFSENTRTEADDRLQKSEGPLICSSDELENFVSQSSERLDRIRRRYSLSEKAKFTLGDRTVRGIRPRFRPTAEILRQVQSPVQNGYSRFQSSINPIPWPRLGVNQPKSIFFPDKRWSSPYFSSEVSRCFVAGSSHRFSHCREHGMDYSLYTVYASGKVTASHNTFLQKREKESSCAFSVLAERGIPEGASSETICEPVIPQHSPSTSEESVVYFSMKV